MPKILHVSDTHVLLNKRHDEYREVFQQIYDLARKQQVTHIVHTGDLFHSKLQLTPECVSLAVEFLRNLADIAPVYMICGNHDLSLKSTKRLDSITPIIEAIKSDRIHYFRNSGEYNFEDVTFGAFSMLDPDNYPQVSDPTKINIALYHGSISGVVTDSGYIISHGDCDVSIFKNYDYALLGDIHISNQKVDDEGRVRYAGSTIQQNFAEDINKGVLIWDIKDKNNFIVTEHLFACPKPFITLDLDNEGRFEEWRKLPPQSRIRLQTFYNLTADRVKNALDAVKSKYRPESVTFVSKALTNKENLAKVSNLSRAMNLRDISVQEELIAEYLKQYNADPAMLERVYELNRRLNSQVESSEEVGRNINWKLKSLEWDNLFNYGEDNCIDFTKLNGVVGIHGKNFSGKSSSMDALLYTLFNTTSKNNRKNLNIINQNREKGRGRATLEIDGNEYVIERTSEKYTKKSKGMEIVEAKTDVKFCMSDQSSLDGIDRNDTDKTIRKYLGSVDDFMLTGFATQFSAQSFIAEGSTNRKAILAKFLDLDLFEAKFKAAKSEISATKAILKKLESVDYDREIKETKLLISTAEDNIEISKNGLAVFNSELKTKREELFSIQTQIKLIERDNDKLSQLVKSKESYSEAVTILNSRISETSDKIRQISSEIGKLSDDLAVDIQQLLDKKSKIDANNKSIDQLKNDQALLKQENTVLNNQIKILDGIPCGTQYPDCKFISNANKANDKKPSHDKKLIKLNTSIEKLNKEQDSLDVSAVVREIKKYENALAIKQKLESELSEANSNAEKWSYKLETAKELLQKSIDELNSYSNNADAGLLSGLSDQEKLLKSTVQDLESKIAALQQNITNQYRESGYCISKLETLEEQKQELSEKRSEFGVYDLFLKCMHPNGISYQVIKNKLPVINEEINKILANVVDFEVFLLNDDDKLDIMIKHPKHEPRPLEMGSGAEKSLSSIAIRLAFLQVTSLPKSQFLILDEPGTSLDAENLSGFIRILDLIKSYFKTVILISHLDVLKDAVDMQIVIERKGDFAYVNQ